VTYAECGHLNELQSQSERLSNRSLFHVQIRPSMLVLLPMMQNLRVHALKEFQQQSSATLVHYGLDGQVQLLNLTSFLFGNLLAHLCQLRFLLQSVEVHGELRYLRPSFRRLEVHALESEVLVRLSYLLLKDVLERPFPRHSFHLFRLAMLFN
jgi:hypothetical protein